MHLPASSTLAVQTATDARRRSWAARYQVRQAIPGQRSPRSARIIALTLGVALLLCAQLKQPAGLLLLLGVGGAALVAMVHTLVQRGPQRRYALAPESGGAVRVIDFPPLAEDAPEWNPAAAEATTMSNAPKPSGPPVLAMPASAPTPATAPAAAAAPGTVVASPSGLSVRREARVPSSRVVATPRRRPEAPVAPMGGSLAESTPAWRTTPIRMPHHETKPEAEEAPVQVAAPPARLKLTLSPVPTTVGVASAEPAK